MKIDNKFILIIQLFVFVLLSNLVLNHFVCRKDISSSRRLTLTESTVVKINSLKKPLVINAFYSGDMPSEYSVRLDLIKEFLIEIQKRNPANIKLNFYDPSISPAEKKLAVDFGLPPNEIQESSKSYREAYMGIVIKYDSEIEVISDFFFVEEAESQFVRALRRIEEKSKEASIAVSFDPGTFEIPLPGNGSGTKTWGVFFHQALVKEYGKPSMVLLNEAAIPENIRVLLVIGSPEWTGLARQRLEDFLVRGGGLIFLGSPSQFQVNPVRNKTGLSFESSKLAVPSVGYPFWDPIFRDYGFNIETDLLFDFEHPVNLSTSSDIQKQYYPLWHIFYRSEGNMHLKHHLTKDMDLLIIPWVSSMRVDKSKQPSLKYENILTTDMQIWKKQNVFSMNPGQTFSEGEIERSRIPIGVLAEGKITQKYSENVASGNAKIFVMSSAYFVNDILSLPEFRLYLRDANVPFLLNVIDYMLDAPGSISSRKKSIAVMPLKSYSSQERNLYSLFNTFFIPLILAIFAINRIRKRNLA